MPRLSKINEIENWLTGKQIVLLEVIYPSFKVTFGVYASNPEEAVNKLRIVNKIPDECQIHALFIAQKIIY